MHNELIEEINIKQDYPSSDLAVFYMENKIEECSLMNVKLLKVIHGYGSHGKGGGIKSFCHLRLAELKKSKIIIDFIKGEELSMEKIFQYKLYDKYPSLIIDKDLSYNSGITLVILK